MKKNHIVICFSLCLLLASIGFASAYEAENMNDTFEKIDEDYDPLVDIEVTVEIQQIRAFDKYDRQIWRYEYIDFLGNPDFYVKVFINDEEFTSDIWENIKYLYDTPFSATFNVPDDEEFVDITIQLWDSNNNGDRLCDIADYQEDVDLTYNVKTGHWTGDDDIGDASGYGRLNGCDDGSIYTHDRDCELWFDIFQNDYDGDMIPYWVEVNEYGTDPEVDNTGEDVDEDEVPIEWEWKWGYNPLEADNHDNLDPELDSIDNVEEFRTSQWDSDPFRKDLFIELDQMEAGPNGESASLLPERSKELLRTAHNRQNLVYHLDDGTWDDSGSDMIPFDEETTMEWGPGGDDELDDIYWDYFLHGDNNNWRRGVFHYGVVIYQCSRINGNVFGSNRFQISANGLDQKALLSPLLNRDIVFASAYMHETGHTLDLHNEGVDNENSAYPWQSDWWKFRPYKSTMNYGYMYTTVDYSDGSHGDNDYNDWEDMDLSEFEREHW